MKTGLKDIFGKEIFVGDILQSRWEYQVVVRVNLDGDFYGELVCKTNDTCKNIPYSLEDSFVKIFNSDELIIEMLENKYG